MKRIKNIFFVAMFSLIMVFQSININAAQINELQSGIYEIKNDVYHEQEIGMSMARTYLDENMKLEKEEGKWYYSVTFTGTEYMENHRILIDGEEVEVKTVDENTEDKTITLKFETKLLIPKLSTQIYVDAMGRDVVFDIIPKEDTLNLVKAIEEPKVEDKVIKDEKTKDTNEKSNMMIYVAVGTVVIVGGLLFVMKKFKK